MTELATVPATLCLQKFTLAESLDRCERDGWLAGADYGPKTRTAYRKGARYFVQWMKAPSLAAAMHDLLGQGAFLANQRIKLWQRYMREEAVTREGRIGLAPATVNQRVEAVKTLAAHFNGLNQREWRITVKGLRPEARRDMSGPTWDLVELAIAREVRLDVRAVMCLWSAQALRAAEALALTMDDVEPDCGAIWIVAKRGHERTRIVLADEIKAALAAYVAARGWEPGPLFPFSYPTAHRLVGRAGERVGVVLRPHGLRHAGITRALDLTDSPRDVQHFSRHKDIKSLMRYDDKRRDVEGKTARRIAAMVAGKDAIEAAAERE